MEELEELYKKYNYPGAAKLYALAKREGVKATHEQVRALLVGQAISQVFHRPKKQPGHIVAFVPAERLAVDLIDMTNFKTQNRGIGWILLGIDVFTRRVYYETAKTKKTEDVLEALEDLVKQIKPQEIMSDNESAFMSKQVQDFFEDNRIIHNTADPGDHKALGVIDAAVKAVKVALYKHMKAGNTTEFTKHLDQVVSSYNDTPHTGIRNYAPDEAADDGVREQLQVDNLRKFSKNAALYDPFEVGDAVRIQQPQTMFNRAYDDKFSTTIHLITKLYSNKAELDGDQNVSLRRLRKVKRPDITTDANAVQVARKTAQVRKKLAQEGIREFNVSSREKRIIKSKAAPVLPASFVTTHPKAKSAPKRYIVEKFLNTRISPRGKEFLVKWEGYADSESTWEPYTQLVKDIGKQAVTTLQQRLK